MQLQRPFFAVIAAAIFVAGCQVSLGGPNIREPFAQTHPLTDGGTVTVDTFNGSVRVEVWDRDDVEITGHKHASSQELLDNIQLDIDATASAIDIKAERIEKRRGSMGVSFVIHVPHGTNLEPIETSNGSVKLIGTSGQARVRTSNGSITLDGHNGPADLHTSNGRIEANEVVGRLEAHTSNGSIVARLSEADTTSPVRLETSNGSIKISVDRLEGNEIYARTSNSSVTIDLPESVGARVRAQTSNGSIRSDIPFQGGSVSKHHAETSVGDGAGLIDVKTSNGSIHLRTMS